MPEGFIVNLPMGTGKTRIVLSHMLHGAGKQQSTWNSRLKRTIIIGPNIYVERTWIRELLLAAKDRRILKISTTEEDIRNKKTGEIKKILKEHGFIIPLYFTYNKIGPYRMLGKGLCCHYLILDEWHRIPYRLREECRIFVETGKNSKWFIGGNNITKNVYFVSATPVNPVLEQEKEVEEDAYEDSFFQEKVAIAQSEAINVTKGIIGEKERREERGFLDAIRAIGIRELNSYGKNPLKWQIPKESNNYKEYYFHADLEKNELHNIKTSIEDSITTQMGENDWMRKEYAYSVGLIRTKGHKKQYHKIHPSKKGRNTYCFGVPYKALHYPKVGKRMVAAKWLCERHTRLKRLVNLLLGEKVLKIDKNDKLFLTKNKKALIFCTHRGVALGVVKGLQNLLGTDTAESNHRIQPVATNVDESMARHLKISLSDYTEELIEKFNQKNNTPFILVATDILSESIDLHKSCNLIVHYELPWSPLRLFQRVGRLTRLKKWGNHLMFNRDVRVSHVLIPGSVEEERINRLIRRIQYLAGQNLWPSERKDLKIVSGLIGSGPSLHYKEYMEKKN